MAEIKIEEKKSPLWPWILLIIAIIAILIYIFAFNGAGDITDDRKEDTTEQTIEESAETRQHAQNNSTVGAYVSFINEEDPDSMGIDHEFTSEAFMKLTNATIAMADEVDYDIEKDIEDLRTHTRKITSDPFETTHANSIRESAEILANTLQNIQQEAFPDLSSEADEVKNAATAIEADKLTLNQRGDVKNFFWESADLLKKMNNN